MEQSHPSSAPPPGDVNQKWYIRIVLSLWHFGVLHSKSCYLKLIRGKLQDRWDDFGERTFTSSQLTGLPSQPGGPGLVGTCVEPERDEASRYSQKPEPHGEASTGRMTL